MKITHSPYYLDDASIASIEDLYDAKYMGPWTIKDSKGSWSKGPVEVFYQYEPDSKKGHTHYFGIFLSKGDNIPYIVNASTAFSVPITGILVNEIGRAHV